jgi:3-oxoacyl-[acyl-carrier protein] reductase
MISKSKRIALITGASANAGARIVIHCGRSASDADSLCKQIQVTGGDADTISVNLAAPDGAAKAGATFTTPYNRIPSFSGAS